MSRFVWQYQGKVEPLEPSIYVQHLDWLRETNQPLFDWEPQSHYYVTFHVEPTLFLAQTLDWLPQTIQPIFEAEFPTIVFVPGQFEPLDYAPTLDWFSETQQPLHDLPRNDALYGLHLADVGLLWVGSLAWQREGRAFLYTAANWPTMSWYFEVYMQAKIGMAFARLWDETASAAITDSEVNAVSGTFARIRSTALTLTDGHEYRAEFATITGDLGGARGGTLIGI